MMSVLVVDDQPLPRLLIKTVLQALNFDVLEATDGHEGLQVYQRHKDNIMFVFVDLMMPVLDGLSMTQALREWEAKQRRQPVPVVACTSEDVGQGTELYQRCLQSGMDDVTNKPINRNICAQILSRFLPERVGPAC